MTYTVEAARVEQRTDLDKLIIEIETNGTIDPEEAIRRAGSILKDQLSVFVDLQGQDEGVGAAAEHQVDPLAIRLRPPQTEERRTERRLRADEDRSRPTEGAPIDRLPAVVDVSRLEGDPGDDAVRDRAGGRGPAVTPPSCRSTCPPVTRNRVEPGLSPTG